MSYIKKQLQTADIEDVSKLVDRIGLATLITSVDNDIKATHFPLQIIVKANSVEVKGHIAKANRQSMDIKAGVNALVVMQGPHSYISPRWYDHENVPTWDYASVHFKGDLQQLESEELVTHLQETVAKYETDSSGKQSYVLSSKLVDASIKAIVGFKIQCTEVNPMFKLSQDKSQASIQGVISGLESDAHSETSHLIELISEHALI